MRIHDQIEHPKNRWGHGATHQTYRTRTADWGFVDMLSWRCSSRNCILRRQAACSTPVACECIFQTTHTVSLSDLRIRSHSLSPPSKAPIPSRNHNSTLPIWTHTYNRRVPSCYSEPTKSPCPNLIAWSCQAMTSHSILETSSCPS